MKLILIHRQPSALQFIKTQLENLDHIVLTEADTPRKLLAAVARHQPHAILIGKLPKAFADEEILNLGNSIASSPIIRLPKNREKPEYLIDFLRIALEEVTVKHATLPIRPYSDDGQRLVLRDDRYRAFSDDDKLGTRVTRNPDAERDVFLRQIMCGQSNHAAAKRYLRQLLKTERGLYPEVAYRVVHSSYKIYWLREHAIRWCSVLGHYIEGVEIPYLPSPVSPSPKLDFLHYEAPPESLYVAAALVSHGFKQSLVKGFCSILAKKFTGQSEELLNEDAVVLSGWCTILREVAMAQVLLMDQALDPDSPWYTTDRSARKIHRAEGIYTEFWSLPSLRDNRSHLRNFAYLGLVDWMSTPPSTTTIAPYRAFFDSQCAPHSDKVVTKENL